MLDRLNALIDNPELKSGQRNIMLDFKRQVERGRELTANQIALLVKFETEANRPKTYVDLDAEENYKRAVCAVFYYEGSPYFQNQRDAIISGKIEQEQFDKICRNQYAEGHYNVIQQGHKFPLDEVLYCNGELGQIVEHHPSKNYGKGTLVYGIIELDTGRLTYMEERWLKTRTRKKKV